MVQNGDSLFSRMWACLQQRFEEPQLEAAFMDARLSRIKWYTALLCLCSITVILCETLIYHMGTSTGSIFDLIFRPMFVMVLFATLVLVNFRPEFTSVCAFTALQVWCPLLTMDHGGGRFSEYMGDNYLCTGFDHFPLVAMFVSALSYLTLVPARVSYSWLVPAALPVSYILWTLPFRPECNASGYLRLSMTCALLFTVSMLLMRVAVFREQLERQVFLSSNMALQEECEDADRNHVWQVLGRNEVVRNDTTCLKQGSTRKIDVLGAYSHLEDCGLDLELSSSDESQNDYAKGSFSSSSQSLQHVQCEVSRYVCALGFRVVVAGMEQEHFKNTRNIVKAMQLAKQKSNSKKASSSSQLADSPHVKWSVRDRFASSNLQDEHPLIGPVHAQDHQSTHSMHRFICNLRQSENSLGPSTIGTLAESMSSAPLCSSNPSASSSSDPMRRMLPLASKVGHSKGEHADVSVIEHAFDGHWELAVEHPDMSPWVRRLIIFGMDVVDGEGTLRAMERRANGEMRLRSGIMSIKQGKLLRKGQSGISWVYNFVEPADHALLQRSIRSSKGTNSHCKPGH